MSCLIRSFNPLQTTSSTWCGLRAFTTQSTPVSSLLLKLTATEKQAATSNIINPFSTHTTTFNSPASSVLSPSSSSSSSASASASASSPSSSSSFSLLSNFASPILFSSSSSSPEATTAATAAAAAAAAAASASTLKLTPVPPSQDPLQFHESKKAAGHKKFVYLKGVKADGRSKRFYKHVSIEPILARARGNEETDNLEELKTAPRKEYAILLDDRWLVTPRGNILSVPSPRMALQVALEWDSQAAYIRPSAMPLMNILVTALDQALSDRSRFFTHFASVFKMDSCVVRAPTPYALVQLQKKYYDPLTKYFETNYGIKLAVSSGYDEPVHPPESLERLQSVLSSLDGWQLAALDSCVTPSKSFLVSWCLLNGHLDIDTAWETARLEENYQMRKYGRVDGVYGHGIDMEFQRLALAAARVFSHLHARPWPVLTEAQVVKITANRLKNQPPKPANTDEKKNTPPVTPINLKNFKAKPKN